MIKIKTKLLTALCFFFVVVQLSAQTATMPSGSGTSGSPYQIATLDNLYWVTQNSASWGKYFQQTADIDASTTSGWADGGFSPIGNSTTLFSGQFDGNNKTISGLYINRAMIAQGMFGSTEATAVIKRITLTGASITGNSSTGGICGINQGTITNCSFTGSLTASGVSSGGIAGDNHSKISNCYTSGQVQGATAAGGIAGVQVDNSAVIQQCVSFANVSSSGMCAGGIVGWFKGTITNSYALGSVSATNCCGGLIGYINAASTPTVVTNCYSTGTVSFVANSGGMIGDIEFGSATITSSYWDTQASGLSTSAGGTSKTTAQMKTQSTFVGWDFASVPVWHISSDTYGYPHLAYQTFVYLAPTIASFSPTSAGPGATVTITGTNFTWASAVRFGGTAAKSFTLVSATSITAVVAEGTTGTISVATPGGTATSSGTFTFITPAPTIASFTPTTAGPGTTITITGTNFTGASAVSLGGTAATSYTVVSATSITAVVANGTTGTISMTTPGGTATSTATFTFAPAPTIASFTPTSAGAGATVTITGTNFTYASVVKFGGSTATSRIVISETSIKAVVASGTTGTISVTTVGGTATSSGTFTFIPAPTITSFTPTLAGVGATVTITGTNFTGATAVSFGGTLVKSYTVVSATSITAVLAVGTTGTISVATAGGTATSSGTFTFLPPTIASFTPTSAAPGATVTITGTNLTGATAVSFGNTAATSYTVVSATSLTAIVASGTTGSVSITTPGGTATRTGFTFVPPPFVAPPTITTFTPATGAIGSSVTITGTNFNTTAAQNIVFFGATQATVTAATATSLTVTVPLGATYQYLSVTNLATHLTAYSAKPFIVTLSGRISFAGKVDSPTGTKPHSVSIGDLDGDGKPDLAVANMGSNTISVFRNTSTSGTVSFATKVDFATSSSPETVSIGDLDGDGKPDLAVTSYETKTVSVFRNTSTSGNVSFATKVDFTTGSSPASVGIGDIDGDGKPDLAVTNYDINTVSIFRNTSTPGSVSFATKVDLATASGPNMISIGDIDGDGKRDLAVTNTKDNNVSVLRNTSIPGSVSFAAKVDFATSGGPKSISIGDIDGDGKPDLAVTNMLAFNVSILRNTSTSGSVSFATMVNFDAGDPLSASICDIDGDGKPDLVVANLWEDIVYVYRNTSTSGTVSFAARVVFTTSKSPHSVSIGDIDGDGKPDLVVAGEDEDFVSVIRQLTPPPTISSFTPKSAGTGATVTITGTNLTGATAVSFGGTAATSFNVVSDTSITAVVASGTTGSVSVTTSGGTATLAEFTFVPPPTITSFTPASAGTGATVTITGTNFTGATTVSFGGTAVTSFNVDSDTSITAVLASGTTGSATVTTAGGTANSAEIFTHLGCISPSIGSQSTSTQTRNSGMAFSKITVTATGTYLTYQWYSNSSASNSGGTSLGSANGAKTNSYVPQSGTVGTMYYYCTVHGDCGTEVTSNSSGAFITNPIPLNGKGTVADPYQISNLVDLRFLSENNSIWSNYFIQTADIDASATSAWNDDGSGGYNGFSPIGDGVHNFTGSYNGQSHTISNLHINKPSDDYIGLFGYTTNGVISNLILTDATIYGGDSVGCLIGSSEENSVASCKVVNATIRGSYSGGLIGESYGSTILLCSVKNVDIQGDYYVAGLVGYSYDDIISKSFVTGTVKGGDNYYFGGFIGRGYYFTVDNCYSTATVSGYYKVGGFVGYAVGAVITNCYSTGHVESVVSPFGGFTSYNGSTFTNCFWDIESSGQATSYGGLGKNTAEMKTQGTFTGWDFSTIWNIESGNGISYPYLRDNVQNPAPGQISKPGAPTSLSASPGNNSATISFTAGSNGTYSIINYEYSTDNGVSFTACSPVQTAGPLTIAGLTNGTTYQVKLRAVSILGSGTASDAVSVKPGPPCANPTDGGTIASDQSGEAPFDPAAFTSTTGASGQTGTIEYKWQSSTTSGITGFGELSSSNSDTYDSGALSVTTWFKRLARVGCMSNWSAAMESNVLKVNILNLDTEPAAQPTGLYFSNSKTADNSNIILSYTASSSARGYLIVRKTGAAPSFVPVDGTSYALGAQGADEIVYNGSALSATDLNVTLGAQYYYKVYAFNGSGNGCNYLTLNPLSGISTCFSQNTGSLSNNSGLSVSAGFPNVGVNVTFPNGTIGTTLNATKTSNTPSSNFSVLPGVRGVSNLYFTITSSVSNPGFYTLVLDFSPLGLNPSQWGTFKILKRTNSSSSWVDIASQGGTIVNRQTDGVWGKFTISGLSTFSDFAGGQAANTWTVTSASETGPGTLKQLISGAVAGDFINFNVSAMGTNTITLTTPVIIDKDLTIQGAASGIVFDGNNVTKVLGIHSASDPQPVVRLEKLTITKGNDSGNVAGGIDNMGNLTMVNCLVVDNTDIDYLDGAGAVGGIFSSGSLTLVNCTIAGNAGAPAGDVGLEGIGGLYSTGDLAVYNTIIYGNTGYYHSMAYSKIKESYNSLYEETQNILANANSVIFIQALPALDNLFGKDPQFVSKYYVTANPYLIFGGSPCVDAGNDSYCFGTTDIRGGTFGRKLDKATGGTGTIDIGAYEWKAGTDPNLFAWTGTIDRNWNDAGNWNVNRVPNGTDNIVVPDVANEPVVNELPNSPAVCNNLDIMSGANVTIAPGKALSVNGVLTNHAGVTGMFVQSTSGASDGTGSLINGTAGVEGTVERYVSGNIWHLISPAATARETVLNFVGAAQNANLIARNATNYALSPWLEATGKWDYYKVSGINTSGLFGTPAKGFQVLRATGSGTGNGGGSDGGKLTFKGTLAGADQNITVSKSGFGWNLIGNPYPCALDMAAFITANTSLLDPSYVAIYVSNIGDVDAKGYSPVFFADGLKLAPGEGFFVRTMAGGGTINFTTAMKTNVSAAFKASNVECQTVQLIVEDGNMKFGTTVQYIGGATKGLDPGKDAGLFNGTASSFSLFTRLIEDNGVDFTIQALPDNNLENMVVPVGLVADKGATVTFKATAANLPTGYKVYLEDRELGTFTRLDEVGNFYSVALNAASNGTGRFYLHTSEIVSAIDESLLNEFKVIPNPEQHLVRIVGNFDLPAKAMVYDMNGKLVATSMLTSRIENDIPLSNSGTGVYLLRTESGKGVETVKFVWKRK